MYRLFKFLKQIWTQRTVLRVMAAREVRQAYVGTFGGVLWTVLLPLATVLTYWFVFSVGFKLETTRGEPYILFFVCGLAPWLMFTQIVASSVGVVTTNPHLVKKVVFPTEVLPVVQLLAALVMHGAMMAVVVVFLLAYDQPVSWYALQLVYYLFVMLVLALGLGWFLAAVNVFFRDVGQITTIIMGLWFWLTPIVWPLEILSARHAVWLKFNPMYYVTQGYRDSLLYDIGIWERPWATIYFWVVCLSVLAVGTAVFRRLKPDFAETL